LAKDAVAGVQHPALKALLAEHWEWTLEGSPRWATTLGDHRFDDRLADPSHEAQLKRRGERAAFLERATRLGSASFNDDDQLTLALFVHELTVDTGREVCDEHLWAVSAASNPVSAINILPRQHPIPTPQAGELLVSRYRGVALQVDRYIANLRRGADEGLFATAESIRRALALVDKQLKDPVAHWALLSPVKEVHSGWEAAAGRAFDVTLRAVVEEQVAPAFARYRDLLRDELLPRARGPQHEGLVGMGRGEACYSARIVDFVGLPRAPRELHALGLRELVRINEEMRALGQELFGYAELNKTLERLRTDGSLYFSDREQILAVARTTLASAKSALPQAFGSLPAADCVVAEVPDYEAPFTTIAYYREPHYDGSKPGEFFVNTYQPRTRPRFEAQVLTFHESIPGQHLQIAIAQRLDQLPAFRKFGGSTAFVEGWALYSERLADEMGLYAGPLDRMGMFSYDAWRASRLVVDTGIHALGWTRQQAERFLMEHTALAANNIDNEVDRYIAWPGQALAYKVGQLEIVRLREMAQQHLGSDFDLRAFHDRMLGSGALSPPVLARQIEAWLDETTRKATQ
jgi:uncharacterized protein (DUF885 family)